MSPDRHFLDLQKFLCLEGRPLPPEASKVGGNRFRAMPGRSMKGLKSVESWRGFSAKIFKGKAQGAETPGGRAPKWSARGRACVPPPRGLDRDPLLRQ